MNSIVPALSAYTLAAFSNNLFSSPITVFPLLLCFPLTGLGDTRHSCAQPGHRIPPVVRSQTLLCAILGPPPTPRPGVDGAASAAPPPAAQRPPQAWRRTHSLEPPGPRHLGLPQAEFIRAWRTGVWRRPQ